MTDPNAKTEAKLRQLSRRLHQAWAKRYPVTEKQLAGVRQVVRQQWQQRQQQRLSQRASPEQGAAPKAPAQTQAQAPAPAKPLTQRRQVRHGH